MIDILVVLILLVLVFHPRKYCKTPRCAFSRKPHDHCPECGYLDIFAHSDGCSRYPKTTSDDVLRFALTRDSELGRVLRSILTRGPRL